MRHLLALAVAALCLTFVGCGDREQVYGEKDGPMQTVGDVTVTLVCWRQTTEHVAYRIKVDNHSDKQVVLFARATGLPIWDGLQVLSEKNIYPSIPAGNELPAEDLTERFLYSTSGMRSARDVIQVNGKSAITIDPKSFKRLDMKGNYSLLGDQGHTKAVEVPWSLHLTVTDAQGATMGVFDLKP